MVPRRVVFATVVLASVAAVGCWVAWPSGETLAESSTEFDGLQVTFAPAGVTFFDERNGDVWIHPFQITGATGVAHFRVSERGAKLTPVPEKK